MSATKKIHQKVETKSRKTLATKAYKWIETPTGHVMEVNERKSWFIENRKDGRWAIYEIIRPVKGCMDGCILRDIRFSLNSAKYRAYLIECEEHNSRYDMELAD